MTGPRWRSIEIDCPAEERSDPPGQDAPISEVPAETATAGAHSQAIQFYHLRQFDACADLLTEGRAVHDMPAADLRLAGIALGRAGRPEEAAAALLSYVRARPDDQNARGALVTAQLSAGDAAGEWMAPPPGPLSEIAGAADWEAGRSLLARRSLPAASTRFRRAAMHLLRHSPEPALPERAPLLYVAVSWMSLIQGQTEAAVMAQRPFLPHLEGVPVLARLIASTAEAATGLRACSGAEREEATAPLHEALVAARLQISFWDGEGPVAMRWEGFMP